MCALYVTTLLLSVNKSKTSTPDLLVPFNRMDKVMKVIFSNSIQSLLLPLARFPSGINVRFIMYKTSLKGIHGHWPWRMLVEDSVCAICVSVSCIVKSLCIPYLTERYGYERKLQSCRFSPNKRMNLYNLDIKTTTTTTNPTTALL